MPDHEVQLTTIISKQQEQLRALEQSIEALASLDLIAQNQQLQAQIAQLEEQLQQVRWELQRAEEEKGLLEVKNSEVRTALFEQMYQEKISFLNVSRQKMDVYFRAAEQETVNRLQVLESRLQQMLERWKKQTQSRGVEEQKRSFDEIETLQRQQTERWRLLREEQQKQLEAHNAERVSSYREYTEEELDEETLRQRIRQNSMELKIGSSWVNKAGILLLLLGVITGARYAYDAVGPELKAAIFFLLGAGLLGIGEYMNRTKRSVFSLGVSGGGIAVLYTSVYVSFFILRLLNTQTAFAVSLGVTLTAFLLALRYNALSISLFALLGGYIPVFLLGGFDLDQLGYYMVYFTLFNLLTLGIAIYRRWNALSFGSYLLNTLTTVTLFISYAIHASEHELWLVLSYVLLSFAMYQGVALAYALKNRLPVKRENLLLVTFNTLSSLAFITTTVELLFGDAYRGLLALLFCALFFAQGLGIERRIQQERYTRDFFYLVAFAFSVLILPLQLGVRWFSLGWLAQSLVFIVFGKRNHIARFSIAGHIIYGLSLIAFILWDCTLYPAAEPLRSADWMYLLSSTFFWRFSAHLAGMWLIVALHLAPLRNDPAVRAKELPLRLQGLLGLAVVLSNFYLIYISERIAAFSGHALAYSYFLPLVATCLLLGFATVLTRQRRIQARALRTLGLIYYLLGFIASLSIASIDVVTLAARTTGLMDYSATTWVLLALQALFHAVVYLCLRDILLLPQVQKRLRPGHVLLLLSGFALLSSANAFVLQFNLGLNSLWLSLLFLVFGLAWIALGFRRPSALVRRSGLGLSLFTTVKVFVFDLSILYNSSTQILAYFAFGLTLLGISYLYHRFARLLDAAPHIIEDKTNV